MSLSHSRCPSQCHVSKHLFPKSYFSMPPTWGIASQNLPSVFAPSYPVAKSAWHHISPAPRHWTTSCLLTHSPRRIVYSQVLQRYKSFGYLCVRHSLYTWAATAFAFQQCQTGAQLRSLGPRSHWQTKSRFHHWSSHDLQNARWYRTDVEDRWQWHCFRWWLVCLQVPGEVICQVGGWLWAMVGLDGF